MELFSCNFESFSISFDSDWIIALQSDIFIIVIKFLRFRHLTLSLVWNSSGDIRPELDWSHKCHCAIATLHSMAWFVCNWKYSNFTVYKPFTFIILLLKSNLYPTPGPWLVLILGHRKMHVWLNSLHSIAYKLYIFCALRFFMQ